MMELSRSIGSPCEHCGRRRRKWASRRSERTGLLRRLSEKQGASETYFDGNLKGQIENRAPERRDLWEVWSARPSDALRMCREKVEEGAECKSTCCSLEDQEDGPPYMQEDVPVWRGRTTGMVIKDIISGEVCGTHAE